MIITQQEIAKEIVRKYYQWGTRKKGQTLSWQESKQCSLIAVDNIIEAYWKTHTNENVFRYWFEVKQEIEKL